MRRVLAPDAPVDLHMHTVESDGVWEPDGLLAHLARERFALAAVTDHDRPDTAAAWQLRAQAAGVALLPAAEMTTLWRGGLVDMLCYGFAPGHPALLGVADDLLRRQRANTRAAHGWLCARGHLPESGEALAALLDAPAAQQPHALVQLLIRQGLPPQRAGALASEAGAALATSPIAEVVAAAHQSGALCIVAHPGRDDGFVCFDAALLDALRRDAPIDGLEVYYPRHSAEQTALYEGYVRQHALLASAGSDSHGPSRPPLRYRAEQCRALLGRLGVAVLPA